MSPRPNNFPTRSSVEHAPLPSRTKKRVAIAFFDYRARRTRDPYCVGQFQCKTIRYVSVRASMLWSFNT